jgi:bifunctional non-homologous end joining protein LigD
MSSACANYVVKESALSFQEGSSDKVYYVSLERVENDKCVVNFAFGRRGNALQTGTKTNEPVDFTTANRIFDKLVQEKMKKGYKGAIISVREKNEVEGKQASKVIPVIKTEEVAVSKCVLLNAIKEEQAHNLISDNDWIIQEKMDGVRYMLEFEGLPFGSNFKGYNRKGKEVPVSEEIKTLFESFEDLPPNCFLDGELIGETFYVFDILSMDVDLREESFERRYSLLAEFFRLYFNKKECIKLVKAYGKKDEKEKLFNDSKAKEGVVFKRKSASYHVGRPASGGDYLKFKFCESCTCIVSSVSNKRSVGISLMKDGNLVPVGNVTIPVNYEIPIIGKHIEVKYLYAFAGGSLIQPVYLGERDDVEVDTIDSIKYKDTED